MKKLLIGLALCLASTSTWSGQLQLPLIQRCADAATATANNLTLNPCEFGLEVGPNPGDVRVKVGDGSTDWNTLPYAFQLTITDLEAIVTSLGGLSL